MEKVTIDDVAAEAGVHKMTVSRALRGLPSVSPATKTRVLQAATKLGYRPNPLVSALMTQVRQGRVVNVGTNLAVLYESGSMKHMEEHPIRRELLAGLRHEAASLNLHLDFHEYRKDSRWNARLEQILTARGISSAVLLAPITPFLELDIDFPHLAPIGIGNRLRKPWIHRVGTDHLGNVELAFEHLLAEGRTRIGYVTDLEVEMHSYNARLNAVRFLTDRKIPPELHIPPFHCESMQLPGFKTWLRKHRPDTVLLMGRYLPLMQRAAEILDDPAKTVYLALTNDCEGLTGVIEANLEIGALAVRLALHSAALGLHGSPIARCSSLLTGTYHRAETPCHPGLRAINQEVAGHAVL